MRLRQAGRKTAVLAALCSAGLGVAGLGGTWAEAASQPVAWGTTQSAPAGTRGELFGVAAASSADVLAVGGFNPGQPPTEVLTKPYAEHWNGGGWTATPVPLGQVYPSGEQAAQLNGVTEVATGNGWAVGTVSDPSSFSSRTLAYHWNGTAWTRSPTPDPGGAAQGNELDAVAARSATDVWAAGGAGVYPEASLVLHWNGSAWRQVSLPNIGVLDAVTVAPGQVWVAGGEQVAQFNGSAWTTLPTAPGVSVITGLAHTAAGLWAVGYADFGCGEGTCTASWAALWNGTTWTQVPAGGGTALAGVVTTGSQVLAAASSGGVVRLTLSGATAQITPAPGTSQLGAIAADPAGNPWAVGWTYSTTTVKPAIINAPGIGQGGITVTTGASGATVTWVGPVNGSGGTDVSGGFAVGGLPDGSYTVTASLPGCQPGVATATVTAGLATAVDAHITCPP